MIKTYTNVTENEDSIVVMLRFDVNNTTQLVSVMVAKEDIITGNLNLNGMETIKLK